MNTLWSPRRFQTLWSITTQVQWLLCVFKISTTNGILISLLQLLLQPWCLCGGWNFVLPQNDPLRLGTWTLSAVSLNETTLISVHFFGRFLEKMPYFIKKSITWILFPPTLVYNLFNYYSLPAGYNNWYDRVDDTSKWRSFHFSPWSVIVGAMPFPSTVPELYSQGIMNYFFCWTIRCERCGKYLRRICWARFVAIIN